MTRNGGIYLIFREESIFSRFNFYYIILNVEAFQTRNLLMCFLTFWKSSIHSPILLNFFKLFK